MPGVKSDIKSLRTTYPSCLTQFVSVTRASVVPSLARVMDPWIQPALAQPQPQLVAPSTQVNDFLINHLNIRKVMLRGMANIFKSINSTTVFTLVFTNTTILTDCNCGIANTANRIVNGVATEENEYPWQVLFHAEDSMGRVGMCGGTILNNR